MGTAADRDPFRLNSTSLIRYLGSLWRGAACFTNLNQSLFRTMLSHNTAAIIRATNEFHGGRRCAGIFVWKF
ncbi:hypothetical protein NECAME_07924 [Necator americanus]|uniref:Uncharacterized protein n=1 Tax=Necator americanus TaxID=51031 RepID=W2TLH1_NECAM|nr:hypothetical protein NECAME_07924 [Necator americanus]ETN82479.1 hypothetical protein NECAME_07924 [Necator americanus]